MVSNLIFYCNNCDASRGFITIRKIVTVAPSIGLVVYLMHNLCFTDSSANECLTTLSLKVFTQKNFLAEFL